MFPSAIAFHLMCSSKKGISALQLHRELGITYKSSWFMCHRIRHAMTHGMDNANLAWAEPSGLTRFEMRQLRELCGFIDQTPVALRPTIPYRPAYSRMTRIIADLRGIHFMPGPGTTGLTCSTFVLAIFNNLENYNLLAFDQWPNADAQDYSERMRAFRLMMAHQAFQAATEFVAEMQSPRPQPAQLIGACLYRRVPIGLNHARHAAQVVRTAVQEYYFRSGIVSSGQGP